MKEEPNEMGSSEAPRSRLDLSAGYIPITAIAVFITATVWLTSELNSINNRLGKIEERLVSSWSRLEMENYILRAQKQVPALPDIR